MFSVGLDLFGSRWELPPEMRKHYQHGELHGDDVLITRKPPTEEAAAEAADTGLHAAGTTAESSQGTTAESSQVDSATSLYGGGTLGGGTLGGVGSFNINNGTA